MWTRTTLLAIAIFLLAIVGNIAPPASAADDDAKAAAATATPDQAHPPAAEEIQANVVPATTPPEVTANNKDNNNAAAAPAAGGGGVEDSKKGSWWAYTHVHIVNQMSGGRSMTVHCKSKNNDMGFHVVPPRSEYQWRFRPSIFGNTLFWCHVVRGNKEIRYDAYYDENKNLWERVYMDNSYWDVRDDGLYLRQFWKNKEVFWRHWP